MLTLALPEYASHSFLKAASSHMYLRITAYLPETILKFSPLLFHIPILNISALNGQ